jgi:hypothetical protein
VLIEVVDAGLDCAAIDEELVFALLDTDVDGVYHAVDGFAETAGFLAFRYYRFEYSDSGGVLGEGGGDDSAIGGAEDDSPSVGEERGAGEFDDSVGLVEDVLVFVLKFGGVEVFEVEKCDF